MATNQEMLDAYTAAEQAVLAGKSYRLAGRIVTMEDLDKIQSGRREYERRVAVEASTSTTGGGASVATWNNNVELFQRDAFGRNVRYR